jgi:hypothetical protein
MPDLEADLAALEARYAEAEQALADRKAEQQADLNARATAFMQETIPMAQDLVKIEGMIDYVKDKMRQPQDEPGVQERIRLLLAEIAALQRIIPNQNAPQPSGQTETVHDAQARQNLATAQLERDTEQAAIARSDQAQSLSLLQRIHSKQEQDAARFAVAAVPENDPD